MTNKRLARHSVRVSYTGERKRRLSFVRVSLSARTTRELFGDYFDATFLSILIYSLPYGPEKSILSVTYTQGQHSKLRERDRSDFSINRAAQSYKKYRNRTDEKRSEGAEGSKVGFAIDSYLA